ncbi:LOW QUALITY PROTEIN: putative inorganic phosphate cotransporter [Nilaparvata lugens]|uniref:LOW QUALITY PROTEIN: putative inorganic phosphate cotransporter n=1 Tax=Nilaparvata lugens TaxID=108931 RepID=UPI00193D98C6|nr:LOW QUALITY PROTEIN: putative inorganic phosphate cotransporter [Nilaparvata lugens]
MDPVQRKASKSNHESSLDSMNEIYSDEKKSTAVDSYGLGVRHLQMFLLFLCLVTSYISRVNLSVAIVAMSEKQDNATDIKVFTWNERIRGECLSSFFWGYLIMNLPAAVLNHKFNGKMLLGVNLFINSILALSTPFIVTQFDYPSLIVIRICQGFVQGFMMPTVFRLLSRWVPPLERARSGAIVLGGINFGSALTFLTSGFLANTSLGWPLIFYASGGMGIIWTILWYLLAANSPDSHKSISQEEKLYIKSKLTETASENVHLDIPWKDILTSPAVCGIVFAHMGQNWGMWTSLTSVPTFFGRALNFDIKDDGLLSALPYIVMWIISFPTSILADNLIKRGYMTIQFSRKFWNTIGQGFTAIFVLILPFVAEYSRTLAVVVYTIGTTLNCCVYFGFNVNHMDVSPNFSTILWGLSNGSANITAILGPLFVGFVIENEHSIVEWRKAFIASAAFFLLGNILFVLLGSGETQPWNQPNNKKKSEDETGK